MQVNQHLTIHTALTKEQSKVLTEEAQRFLVYLHRFFGFRRKNLLAARKERQKLFDQGIKPCANPERAFVRGGQWYAANPPQDLLNRRVEITGPTDRKMMINALNSGAQVFMADLEDSLSPHWSNVLDGHLNLQKAIRREIDFKHAEGKSYKLNDQTATLIVRPRGWHLAEKNVSINGEALSASLFDFGLHFFHNAKALIERGSGPYFYLPKLESHEEAKLWNDVFTAAQNYLDLPQGTIRVTVLVETIQAALSMEEIVFELREHICGLNAGRWDYIFSFIKNFARHGSMTLPDRGDITMTVPFMKAYTEKLVQICHSHNIHAIGGMSAFIPNRRNEEVNARALTAVACDKKREAENGFDGSWVAHPDLVQVAANEFKKVLGDKPHQKEFVTDYELDDTKLLNPEIQATHITDKGLRNNIMVALEYIDNWLSGLGAVAINNLMEDAATAEISRAQLWQWIRNKATLDNGDLISPDLYQTLKKEEKEKLTNLTGKTYEKAEEILDEVVLNDQFVEFFTLVAYQKILKPQNTDQLA